MPHKTFPYIIAIWIMFTIVGILLNLAFRSSFMLATLGAYAGHVINTVVLTCFILFVVYRFLWFVNIQYHNSSDLLFIGIFWVVLSVLLEFFVGYYYRDIPWKTLAGNYNILKGRYRSVVLLSELVAPYLLGSIRRRRLHLARRPTHRRRRSRR